MGFPGGLERGAIYFPPPRKRCSGCILKAKSSWDTLIWFGALVMMATFLGKLGLIGWFSLSIQQGINHLGLGWISATVILVLIYLYAPPEIFIHAEHWFGTTQVRLEVSRNRKLLVEGESLDAHFHHPVTVMRAKKDNWQLMQAMPITHTVLSEVMVPTSWAISEHSGIRKHA